MENNRNKVLICLIVVLIILVSGLVGYIIYNTILSKEENNVVESIKDSKVEISVETALDYVDNYYKMFKVKLPKIVGESKTIDELNKKILNEMLPETYSYVASHAILKEEAMDKGAKVDYEYLIKDNIVIIYIKSSVPDGGKAIPATGGGLFFQNYFYDINNDKILTFEEVIDKLNIKEPEDLTNIQNPLIII